MRQSLQSSKPITARVAHRQLNEAAPVCQAGVPAKSLAFSMPNIPAQTGADVIQQKSKVINTGQDFKWGGAPAAGPAGALSFSMGSVAATASSGEAPIQRIWKQQDSYQYWDKLIDGVRWYRHANGQLSYAVEQPQQVLKGNSEHYGQFQGEQKSWEEWNALSIDPIPLEDHVSHASSSSSHATQPRIPDEAQTIMDKYLEGSGLLIRSVQDRNAAQEFNFNDPFNGDGGLDRKMMAGEDHLKKNWSLGHGSFAPTIYKFGAETMPRYMATLADPDQVGDDRYKGVFSSDAASNAKVLEDTPLIPRDQVHGTIRRLAESQRGKVQSDNSEIQTIGFNANAVVGFLFDKPASEWPAHKKTFQGVVDTITTQMPGRQTSTRYVFYVFALHKKIEAGHGKSNLSFIDQLRPN